MEAGYRLRAAEARDLAALPGIERRAGALYTAFGFPAAAMEDSREPEAFSAGLASAGLWVAVDGDDRPVGFALAAVCDGATHLEELDVDPDHGRRGIGAALVERVCADARRRGHEHVTLTTYAHVPWNAPYYERLGFRVLARGEIGPDLARVVEREAEELHEPGHRVAMRRRVSHGASLLLWTAGAWLLGIALLSFIASEQPRSVLPWTRILPGRDKTAHFLLMGGFAFVSVMALAGRRVVGRRFGATGVLLVVTAIVVVEEAAQWWLPLRNFSLDDLASSLAGVAVFGAVAALWRAHRSG